MVAILEKGEHNVGFHPIVDFVEASPFRYALTFKPTIYVSHIRQFWSTARIKTTEEGTKILATVDGIHRTVTESSFRRNLKLQDEEGISSLPDTELFESLTLTGYNISLYQKFTFQKGKEPAGIRTTTHEEVEVRVWYYSGGCRCTVGELWGRWCFWRESRLGLFGVWGFTRKGP
nr:hypothetical protein [Tanacetum cinerariifolium]